MDVRPLTTKDAPLLVEATSKETGRALWDSHPTGPYSLEDAEAALAKWAGRDQSFGVFENNRLVAAVGLMPDAEQSAELAYWVRPESRGKGLAVKALSHLTKWAHDNGFTHLWLENPPGQQGVPKRGDAGGLQVHPASPQPLRRPRLSDMDT